MICEGNEISIIVNTIQSYIQPSDKQPKAISTQENIMLTVERQTDRYTDRQTETDRDTQRDTHTHTHTHTHIH